MINIKSILAAVVFIMLAIAVITWSLNFDDFMACLENPEMNDNDCFTEFFLLSRPVKDATDLATACNETGLKCAAEISTKVIEEKITE